MSNKNLLSSGWILVERNRYLVGDQTFLNLLDSCKDAINRCGTTDVARYSDLLVRISDLIRSYSHEISKQDAIKNQENLNRFYAKTDLEDFINEKD